MTGERIGRDHATIIKIPQLEGNRSPVSKGKTTSLEVQCKYTFSESDLYHWLTLHSRARIVVDHDIYAQLQTNDSFVPYITKAIAEKDLRDDGILS